MLASAISINQRNPHRVPKNPARGYYLALTFGTLLSSQGADAHELDPSGLPSWLDVPLAPVSSNPLRGGLDRRPSRAARRRENDTRPRRTPAAGSRSGDAARSELHAHP